MDYKSLKKFRLLIMILSLGSVYFLIEGLYRGVRNWPTLIGEVSIWMLFIGGIIGVILGWINRSNMIRANLNAFFQSILGSLIITIIEFVFGCLFIFLGFPIWSYLNLKYDWLAQITNGSISFTFMFVWFLLCPFGYWLYDLLTYIFFDDGNVYPLWIPYIQLLQFWKKPNIQKQLSI